MTEKLLESLPRDGARRKLVRGAFAMPAVLTLHNGSALANTSATRCLVNQNSPGSVLTMPATDAADNYFRYRLWVIKNGGGVPQSYWIKGADLTAYVRAQQAPFVTSSQWWQFNPDIGYNTVVGSSATTTAPMPNGSGTFDQTGRWVALRVSSTGQIVGAGASNPGPPGSAVGYYSCWQSFAMQTAP